MRALRRNGISLSGRQSHLFLWLLKKDPDGPRHDVERVVDVVVIVPGHLLCGTDLQFGNAESGPRRVVGPTLYFVEATRILHSLHPDCLRSLDYFDVGVADDLRPSCRFRFDLRLEVLGGADGDGKTDGGQAFLDLRPRENFFDLAIEL